MSESLLRVSEVLLFGRQLSDIELKSKADVEVVVATKSAIDVNIAHNEIEGVTLAENDLVLVKDQDGDKFHEDNDVYQVQNDKKLEKQKIDKGDVVLDKNTKTMWLARKKRDNSGDAVRRFKNNEKKRSIGNKQLEAQWGGKNPKLARIYGFGFEGTYYELPNPTVFLVHGKGESVTDGNKPGDHASRAPTNPSLSGLAAADFQFSDDVMMWSYDKADYSIRMDVETGMLEQVLLDAYFGGDDGAFVSGSKVSGSKVSGSKVAGSKVRGSKLRGD